MIFSSSERLCNFHRTLQLHIPPLLGSLEIPIHCHIWFNSLPFNAVALPAHIGTNGKGKPVPVTKDKSRARGETPGCLPSDQGSETVLFRELCHHFGSSGRVLIDEENNFAVERAW